MQALVITEHDNAHLRPATLQAVTAALACTPQVDVLVAGHGCAAAAEQARAIQGVRRVWLADAPALAHGLAENLAPLVAQLAADYSHVLAASSSMGRNVLPRAAALLDCAPVSDICKVVSPDTFERPIYAGALLATVQSSDRIKLLTVRTTAFESAAVGATPVAELVAVTHAVQASNQSSFVSAEFSKQERPELTAAKVVVSGGRALGSAENFALLNPLADRLGAALGASRAAVDAGFAPNDWQVGQTGKVVAPQLYIAVGISGAIQHLAGMKDSKVIVAINKDPEAPIFQVADYGLVADLFQAVPELTKALG